MIVRPATPFRKSAIRLLHREILTLKGNTKMDTCPSNQLLRHFERESLVFYSHRSNGTSPEHALFLPFEGRHTNMVCRVSVNDDFNAFRVVATCGLRVPRKSLPRVAELMAKINFGLNEGGFCIDAGDRELVFVESIRLYDATLTDDLIGGIIGHAAAVFATTFPKFAKIIFGGVSRRSSVDADEPSPEQTEEAVARLLGEGLSDGDAGAVSPEPDAVPADPAIPVKRKRGRPRKQPIEG